MWPSERSKLLEGASLVGPTTVSLITMSTSVQPGCEDVTLYAQLRADLQGLLHMLLLEAVGHEAVVHLSDLLCACPSPARQRCSWLDVQALQTIPHLMAIMMIDIQGKLAGQTLR